MFTATTNTTAATCAAKMTIQKIKDGDQEIIVQLYKEYRQDFIRWAKNKFSIEKDDTEDIFQETVLDFYLAIRDLKLTEINVNIKTYLFACCKNRIYKLKKYKEKNVSLEKLNEFLIPDKVADDNDLTFEIVKLAISKLPNKYEHLVNLYYLQENCLEAVSQKLNYKNVNVAKKTKSNCMKMLAIKVREIECDLKIKGAIVLA
jgi:RNA polymerase sigma factor (sigma-70 family)